MKQIITIRFLCCAAAVIALALPGKTAESESADLDVVRVRPNFYMIAGAGGNIGVQIGSDGVVLVNAGAAKRRTRFWPQSRN